MDILWFYSLEKKTAPISEGNGRVSAIKEMSASEKSLKFLLMMALEVRDMRKGVNEIESV